MVKDWKRVKIGELLDFKNGLNKGKDFFGSGTPIINYMDVYKKNGLHSADITGKVSLDEKEIKRYEVKKGDVFFTRTSETPEEVGIASVLLDDIDACVFSGFVLRGRPKTDMLLPEYCKYCFSTHEVRQKIIASCTYTTRALTNGTQLSKIEISVPDKDEQFRIVSSLTEVDQLIDKSEKLVKKYQDLKQACLQHMFPRAGQKEPDVRLPGFTGPWEQRKLGELATFNKGAGYSKSDLKLSGTQIILYGRLYTKYETVIKQVDTFVDSRPGSVYSEGGEVIVPASGETAEDIAIASVVEKPGILLGGDLNIIHPICNLDSTFLAISISNGEPHKEMAKRAQGKSVVHLHNDDLSQIKFRYPSIEEQSKISKFFSNLDNLITLHQRTCEKYKKIKQGMMEELLSGKIRLV